MVGLSKFEIISLPFLGPLSLAKDLHKKKLSVFEIMIQLVLKDWVSKGPDFFGFAEY